MTLKLEGDVNILTMYPHAEDEAASSSNTGSVHNSPSLADRRKDASWRFRFSDRQIVTSRYGIVDRSSRILHITHSSDLK